MPYAQWSIQYGPLIFSLFNTSEYFKRHFTLDLIQCKFLIPKTKQKEQKQHLIIEMSQMTRHKHLLQTHRGLFLSLSHCMKMISLDCWLCANLQDQRAASLLQSHKAFIYLQVSVGRVQSKDRRRDLHLSLNIDRGLWVTEMATGASLSGALLDGPPLLLLCGLNNIIKNDHQRAHCKQIILLGAWRTNLSLKARCSSSSRLCVVIPNPFRLTSGHFPLV